jgi:predicted permease
VRDYYDRVAERLAAIPGVRHVGATSNLPLTSRNQTTSIDVEGVTVASPADRPNVQRRAVRRGFFPAMGIPLRAGRFWADTTSDAASANEIVVDEAMAKRTWPNESALGKRIRLFGAWFPVVGVVGDVRHGRVDEVGQPTVYVSHARQSQREMTLVLATAGNPADYIDAVRRATWSVDPTIPIVDLEPMTARVERSLSAERYRTTLLGAFGVAAAVLTAVGIFGVIGRAVSQRRREIAIRVALGAPGASVARAVVAHQGRSVAFGVALGLFSAWLSAPALGRFVYGVGPSDSLALLGAAGVLVAVAVVAACIPVRDAVRTDPGLVLRDIQ